MLKREDYKGKKAVVTGAANGIGKCIARKMAECGADVLLVDIHGDEAAKAAEEIRALGVQAESIQADVSVKEECKKVFDKAMELFGRCDILVNDAGVSASGDVWNIPERDIRWVYEVNVYSHWFMMGYFIPQMEKQGTHCQIVNVCSIAGLITSPSSPAYFSSKHAAVALSEVVYKQLRDKGDKIDVSVFCPGFVQTEMWQTDRHRPERFAVTDDPYYHNEDYQKNLAVSKYVLDNGTPLEETIDSVFKMLEEGKFYLLTHDRYDGMLRAQGVWQAEKVRPVELSDVGTSAQLVKEV